MSKLVIVRQLSHSIDRHLSSLKMSRLFGRSKAPRQGNNKKPAAPTTGEAIQSLRETEDMLNKKQDFLEKKIEAEVATARKNAKTNKRAALAALKRKKKYDEQLRQIDGTLTTLEHQRMMLEGASTNTAVLKNMDEAAKAMKRAHGDMDIDQVHDMMDDIAEQHDISKEISDAISNPVAFGHDFDEDELLDELNDLEAELELEEQAALDKELIGVGPTPNLPDVPNAALPAVKTKKKEEDDDMAQLAAWAS